LPEAQLEINAAAAAAALGLSAEGRTGVVVGSVEAVDDVEVVDEEDA
jgi:hypothetical protein